MLKLEYPDPKSLYIYQGQDTWSVSDWIRICADASASRSPPDHTGLSSNKFLSFEFNGIIFQLDPAACLITLHIPCRGQQKNLYTIRKAAKKFFFSGPTTKKSHIYYCNKLA